MYCYNCGCQLSEKDFCTSCGADVGIYKRIMSASNFLYNKGLEKAGVRDLSGAVVCLRQSLKFNKENIDARNLLGLVYYEMGEVVLGLGEWVISKNLRPEKNIADDYINMIQENPSRLETINQTIKKYNLALGYCGQDSLDLAVIQLKKVLSLNPNYVRAHQLLALLFMQAEEWERAKKELDRCLRIDTGNTTTLRYAKEVERALEEAENARAGTKKKKERKDVIKYQSGNETIIQPVGGRDKGGFSTVLNIGIGIVIGIAAASFLILPARLSTANNQAQDELRAVSEQLDKKTSAIEELEQQAKAMDEENAQLRAKLQDYAGSDGVMDTIDTLLHAVGVYLSDPEEVERVAEALEPLDEESVEQVESESFQRLYHMLLEQAGPDIAAFYYKSGTEAYRKEQYEEALESLQKAWQYNEQNGDILYDLANCYRQLGNKEEAVKAYKMVIEQFEGTEKAKRSQNYLDELNAE